MSFISLTLALFLALLALGIIVFFFRIFWSVLIGDPRDLREQWLIRRREKTLQLSDELLKKKLSHKCIPLLRESFYLDPVRRRDLIDRVTLHNLAILARVITISEHHARRLSNLPIVEDLFQSRSQLLKMRAEIHQSKFAFFKRRKAIGKDTPAWAFNEYCKKLEELQDKIDTNRKSLESQLHELFSTLEQIHGAEEVTYH